MHLFTTIALWVLGTLLAIYLIVAEFLDTIGRIELVEKRWPRAGRAMSNRPFRLILIFFLVVLVAKDVQERMKEFEVIPSLIVKIASLPPPIFTTTGTNVHPLTGGSVRTVQKGNGNSANPGSIAARVTMAPCSSLQNGGSHNTSSVNCLSPERHITVDQREKIVAALTGRKLSITVGAFMNVPDAQQYGFEICDAVRQAIAETKCDVSPLMQTELSQHPFVGVGLVYKGESGPDGGRVSLPFGTPAAIVRMTLLSAGIEEGWVNPKPDIPENTVEILIGRPAANDARQP